ncbi:hypothetical protein DSECCO2_532400 [anaerobic digester metagenome]
MDDKPKKWLNKKNLVIVGALAILLVVVVGLIVTGTLTTTMSKNPSKMTGEIINYTGTPGDLTGVYKVQIKLVGSNLPEGQKNFFKVIGNLNGTPAETIWYNFPEGSKLANGMIITLADPGDLSIYDSFTIYLYDKPLLDEKNVPQYPDPIFNVTVKNIAHK